MRAIASLTRFGGERFNRAELNQPRPRVRRSYIDPERKAVAGIDPQSGIDRCGDERRHSCERCNQESRDRKITKARLPHWPPPPRVLRVLLSSAAPEDRCRPAAPLQRETS